MKLGSVAMLCVAVAAAAVLGTVGEADATVDVTCGTNGMVTLSWSAAPGVGTYYLFVGSSTFTTSDTTFTTTLTPGTQYIVKVFNLHDIGAGALALTTFECKNNPPYATAGYDFSEWGGVNAYLSGGGYDDDFDDITIDWACSDGITPIPQSTARQYAHFVVPTHLFNGHEITCTISVSDGYLTTTDSVTVTVKSGNYAGEPDETDETPTTDPPTADTTTDTTRTGGGSGEPSRTAAPPTFFIPSPAPASQGQPTGSERHTGPAPPAIYNGTLDSIKMRSIPHLDGFWNGTTITPMQCNVTEGGYLNIFGLDYLGMIPEGGHFNATDITTGESAPFPLLADAHIHNSTTPDHVATFNITLHATVRYNQTDIGEYGALLGVDTGTGHIWLTYPATRQALLDIFDQADVLYMQQYGRVSWEAGGGSCWVP